MKIVFSNDENDILIHQLFIASKSERIRKKRLRNRIIMPVIYSLFALLSLYQGKDALAVIIFVPAILWLFIYPIWERNHYIKHYKGSIKENYSSRFGKSAMIEVTNEYILTVDDGSESKILTSELEDIWEIPSTIFIRIRGGQSIVLPKDKISNSESVIAHLQELAEYLKINYEIDYDWKWR